MIILPGMGADSSMFPEIYYKKIKGIDFVNWPEYNNEKTIEEVAARVIEQYNIENDDIIGGASLGGIVALQISKMLNISRVILISGATNPSYINPVLKKLSGLVEITPFHFIQFLAGKINIHLNKDVLSMFERSNSEFLRAMCKAVFEWEGIDENKCDIRQIHGQLDMVIFPPKNKEEIIPGGGHLITMTHGELVSKFIQNNINYS